MGWTYPFGLSKKQMIAERIEDHEWVNTDGVTVKTTCLAHCYRGNPHAGVLYAVRETSYTKDGQPIRPSERWIQVDALHYWKKMEGWGYKDMDESMGPYYFSCPLGYLAMVPQVASEDWRDSVRKYHADALARRRERAARRKGAA